VRERVRAALARNAVVDHDVVWSDRGDVADFRVPADGAERVRSAEELPAVEAQHAMAWLLRQHQAIAVDDLAREAARRFGITRLGVIVRQAMDTALSRLVADGGGQRDGDVRLP
jgi:hypothetical protein